LIVLEVWSLTSLALYQNVELAGVEAGRKDGRMIL